ncbi:MAG TPA: hypothetical protein VK753_07020 [Xanthomonadaceae bacterium]|jgi:hypothetical protein|nr:hypothetical protein [Xanthomonadaceae bacterium]
MQTFSKVGLALLLLIASNSAFAIHVSQKQVCQNTSVPSGWVIANKTWNRTTCGSPSTPQANVWVLDEYGDLPVGTTLTICAFSSSVPSGWVPTSFNSNPGVCGAQYGAPENPYNTVTIAYAICTNESNSLCYPSLSQFGVIAAVPTTVDVPYGQANASTNLGWFASTSKACVWVTTEGVGTQLWSCDGNAATQTWPYVSAGVSQTFILSPNSTSASPVLSSVVVTGVEGTAPKIHASPTVVTVRSGQTDGSTTVSYNLIGSDYSSMCIWASNNGQPAQLWACGSDFTFSQVWPYVPKGGTTKFWLNPSRTSSSQVLATITVTGK